MWRQELTSLQQTVLWITLHTSRCEVMRFSKSPTFRNNPLNPSAQSPAPASRWHDSTGEIGKETRHFFFFEGYFLFVCSWPWIAWWSSWCENKGKICVCWQQTFVTRHDYPLGVLSIWTYGLKNNSCLDCFTRNGTAHWGLFAIVVWCGIFKNLLSHPLPQDHCESVTHMIHNWSILNILNFC